MTGSLPAGQFEAAYEMIARALDRVGPGRERLFLARLALALAHRLPDLDALEQALAIAEEELEGSSGQERSAP